MGRRPSPLPEDDVRRRLAGSGSAWQLHHARLTRTLRFGSYGEVIRFVNEVAQLAEDLDHHPELTVTYREVTVRLWSHDAGGVTDRDFDLAGRIDVLAPPS